MRSLDKSCQTVTVRVTKGIFTGITGLLSSNTRNGLYVIWGDVTVHPLVYGPFDPDEIEVLQSWG